ncbi:helix-turn-helix transcriptional regulator [Xanthomarina gelatinilytica]|uniref:helix-turn-helix transcriptional regulator n=1 Tax=Xanthomarina gelatinilytica TaxID=1137281 RepID=UPI003AA89E4B
MSTNKNAIIRYHTLDRCFSNPGKRYYIEDLLKACNDSLLEIDPYSTGIKKRQLFDDIKFMESSNGWNIPLDKVKDGRRVYYKYKNISFSINNQPLNKAETEQLKSAMLVLTRFKGLPHFQWVDELLPKLNQTFTLSKSESKIISFENNEFLKGTEFITPLFNAVKDKQSLYIKYKSFKSNIAEDIIFSPYHLKQYNNRWFVFGKQNKYNSLTNLALDRINSVEHSAMKYDKSLFQDFNEYFEDIIGVTKPIKKESIKIELLAKTILAPYIKTKPLHGSQKKIKETEEGFFFSIEVIPNYELVKLILSFGENLIVKSPESIREDIKRRIELSKENYNDAD